MRALPRSKHAWVSAHSLPVLHACTGQLTYLLVGLGRSHYGRKVLIFVVLRRGTGTLKLRVGVLQFFRCFIVLTHCGVTRFLFSF